MFLTQLFYPQSIAVIWASQDKTKIGSKIFFNILKSNYEGEVFPVNNDGIRNIDEYLVYHSIKNIKKKIDLVIIVIPARFVEKILLECVDKNIKNIVIISAGFKEIWGDGENLETSIKRIAQENKINILGPNCLGLINTNQKLNASFATQYPLQGNISFISQSGALGTAALGWFVTNNLGLSKFISLGNETVLDEADVLEYLFQDEDTKVIMAYLEQIGNGEKLKKVLENNKNNKPVIVFKSGVSKQGQKAASSHTGALGNDNNIFDVFCQKYNIIRVNSVELMFNLAKSFSLLINKNKTMKKIVIVTNAGWFGVITTDYLEQYGLKLANIPKEIKEKLRKILGDNISVNNPIDLVGDANSQRYEIALTELINNKEIEVVLVLLTKQENTDDQKIVQIIEKYSQKTDKIIMSCFIGGEELKESKQYLQQKWLPIFDFPEKMIAVLAKMKKFNDFIDNNEKWLNKNYDFKKGLKKGQILNEVAVYEYLEKYQFPIAEYRLLKKGKIEKTEIEKFNFPLVLKVSSAELLHKSDQGGVIVNIRNINDLEKSITQLQKNFPKKDLLMQIMKKGGEFILGVKKDPQFGHLLLVGYGGIYVEVYKDLMWLLFPFSKEEFLRKLRTLKMYKIISGIRGQKSLNEDLLAELALKIQSLVRDNPNITEIDFNPVILNNRDIWICDGIIKT